MNEDKVIKYKHEIGIDADIWVNAGIFIFLWIQFNLKIAAIGIAVFMIIIIATPIVLDN